MAKANKKTTPKAKKKPIKITTAQKKKMFLEAYRKNGGHVSKAADLAGINRRTYYQWLEDDDKFYQDAEDAMEAIKDDMEEMLRNQGSFSPTSTIFWLKSKCKERGYADETNININQAPQSIMFTPVDNIQDVKIIEENNEKKEIGE